MCLVLLWKIVGVGKNCESKKGNGMNNKISMKYIIMRKVRLMGNILFSFITIMWENHNTKSNPELQQLIKYI